MATINLYGGKKALVDDEVFEMLNERKWHFNCGYVRGYKDGSVSKMHRVIMGAQAGEEVDHINGDALDNRKSNLRIATHSQNQSNRKTRHDSSTGYKGVYYDKTMSRRKRWGAKIYHEGKRIQIGRFFTPEEAAKAYDSIALKLKGQYARLNFGRIAS